MSKRDTQSKSKLAAVLMMAVGGIGMLNGCAKSPGTPGANPTPSSSLLGLANNKTTFSDVTRKKKTKRDLPSNLDFNGLKNGTCFDNDCANQSLGSGKEVAESILPTGDVNDLNGPEGVFELPRGDVNDLNGPEGVFELPKPKPQVTKTRWNIGRHS